MADFKDQAVTLHWTVDLHTEKPEETSAFPPDPLGFLFLGVVPRLIGINHKPDFYTENVIFKPLAPEFIICLFLVTQRRSQEMDQSPYVTHKKTQAQRYEFLIGGHSVKTKAKFDFSDSLAIWEHHSNMSP